jgi:hypothetical protein
MIAQCFELRVRGKDVTESGIQLDNPEWALGRRLGGQQATERQNAQCESRHY